MSRPIKLTNAKIKDILNELGLALTNQKMFDGEVNVTYREKDTNETTVLDFTPLAYSKMLALVNNFDTEVAWHGTIERGEGSFIVKDIFVYPQEVSGATVNTDQEKYEQWLYGLDDNTFNALRFQGHSHVNMGTSPSGVDTTHQEKIVEQLGDDDFYVFVIWNKKNAHTIKIVDTANNVIYFDEDIAVTVGGVCINMDKFITDAKGMVTSKSYLKADTKKSSKPKYYNDDFDYYEYLGFGR